MARNFATASDQYLSYSGEIVSPPFTVSALFYANDANTNYYIWTQADTTGVAPANAYALFLNGSVAGDKVGFFSYRSEYSEALTSTGFSANTWHHAAGRSLVNTDIAVLIDGGSKGTAAGPSVNPIDIDNCLIGGLLYADSAVQGTMDGYIAEVATWNVELTDAEVAVLATGVHPFAVRPQSLVSYLPLIGRTSPEIDIVGGYDMTLNGGPTTAAHPPVMYPVSPMMVNVPAIAAAVIGPFPTFL